MTRRTVSEAAADLIASAEHRAASEEGGASTPPSIELAMANVLTAEVHDFADVRAMTWFAHCQMGLAFQLQDNATCLAALERARTAISRVAAELGVVNGPPRKGELS